MPDPCRTAQLLPSHPAPQRQRSASPQRSRPGAGPWQPKRRTGHGAERRRHPHLPQRPGSSPAPARGAGAARKWRPGAGARRSPLGGREPSGGRSGLCPPPPGPRRRRREGSGARPASPRGRRRRRHFLRAGPRRRFLARSCPPGTERALPPPPSAALPCPGGHRYFF